MILKIFGLALVGAFMSFVLKAFGWRGAPLVAVGAMLALLSAFADSFEKLRQIFDIAGNAEGMADATEYILKILGIGYVSGISSDICKELGEAGIASMVLTVARIEALVVISPMILEIMTLGLELVN